MSCWGVQRKWGGRGGTERDNADFVYLRIGFTDQLSFGQDQKIEEQMDGAMNGGDRTVDNLR